MNQQTAQGLASLGRGPDTMLVHMAPEEVAGLQALALKHGGTLTINPETGLAEAGFLKNILPMVAGFALGPAGFGLMSSAMAGLTVGGISALTSGSLEKGLMAGLGAYGGSGLGESLMGAGTGAISSAAGAGAPQVAAESIVPQAAFAPATDFAAGNVNAGLAAAKDAQMVAANAAPSMPYYGPSIGAEAGNFSAFPTTVTSTPAISTSAIPTPPAELAAQTVREQNAAAFMNEQNQQQAVAKALANKTPMDRLGAGFDAVTSSSDAALKFAKNNAMPLGALGIAALSGGNDDRKVPTPQSPGMIRPYTYARTKVPSAFDRTPNDPMSSKERQYFNDQYTALSPYKAPGPEYMAEGGTVGGYTYDPKTGLYTKPGGQGATTVSPTGGISDASAGGGNDPYVDPNPAWSAKSSSERAAYFADPKNALMQDISLLGLKGIGLTKLGLAQNYFVPDFVKDVNTYTQGIDPSTGLFAGAGKGQPTGLHGDIGVQFNPDGSVKGYDPSSYPSGATTPDSGPPGADPASDSGRDAGNSGSAPGGGAAAGGLMAMAQGGIANLGDYSDGGRLLRGPGDGVSDSIPATIANKQPARLADGEFVVPARIVSELGNGSTEAGARKLYQMLARVQNARKKSIGEGRVAVNSRADKMLPA